MENNIVNEQQNQVLVAPEGNPTTEGEMQLANNGARPLDSENGDNNQKEAKTNSTTVSSSKKDIWP